MAEAEIRDLLQTFSNSSKLPGDWTYHNIMVQRKADFQAQLLPCLLTPITDPKEISLRLKILAVTLPFLLHACVRGSLV